MKQYDRSCVLRQWAPQPCHAAPRCDPADRSRIESIRGGRAGVRL